MCPFGFLGGTGIREMQGFLHSRWSVEMTGIRDGLVRATVVLVQGVGWNLKADGAHEFEGVAGLYDAGF